MPSVVVNTSHFSVEIVTARGRVPRAERRPAPRRDSDEVFESENKGDQAFALD